MYKKKYFYEFCPLRKENEIHTVEIWQDTNDIVIAEEITAGPAPITRELPDVDHKFQPTRGTGATLSLFSTTNMKFFEGLKQTFDKEFKVVHKINGTLFWSGYLNQDMQIEPYDEECNYIVTATANDGFALLDRYRFVDENNEYYSGNKSLWEIISIIVSKIGLEYNSIKVALSTSVTGMTQTVLHSSFINCANFYDEDNLPMTMRKVLDSILQPWGAYIIQDNGSLNIVDLHTLAANESVNFLVFSAVDFSYVGASLELNRKTISEIGYYGVGQSIDRSGGTNRQVVSYSPYPRKIVMDETIVTPGDFAAVPENFSMKDGYYYKTLYSHSVVDATVFEETCSYPGLDNTVHATLPYNFPNPVVLQVGTIKPIIVNIAGATYSDNTVSSYSGRRATSRRYADGVALLIEGDLLAKVTANPYMESDVAETVVRHGIGFTCQIGNKYYNRGTDSWQSTPADPGLMVTNASDNSGIGNIWTRIGINGQGLLLRLGSPDENTSFNGNLIFSLTPDTKLQIRGNDFADNPMLDETWIKNLSIKLVNIDGSEIADNDIEYIGVLDQRIAKEGEKIELICGTQSMFCDRGKLMYENESSELIDILEATRAGQVFKIEELLLCSLCSNYRDNFLTLGSMKLKNNFSLINILTDEYIDGSLMMLGGALIDYEANTNTCKLVEISQDELDIIK